ncbi:hypothetical protein C3489_28105 [Streptomyces sp. Ru71]|uniref:DUF6895 family protein n=1 Tax=Streptomyces sp. Ru71 TaxID=2080746 RepID=UPI000CDD739B|nr:hypothetical protein C3489_28105 [Streptomyces sp. Ru71]
MTAARVREVVDPAFAWLSAERDRFVLGEEALDDAGAVNTTWKPLGELAQVCSTTLHRTTADEPLHRRARDLLAFAWRQTEHGELLLRQQRREPFSTYPLEVYAAFASAGLRHEGFAALAARLAAPRGRRLVEQVPVRRLGVLLAERHCGRHPDGEVPDVLSRTWLGGLAEPWAFERLSGYALTHVVYHLTDWGRGGPGLPPRLADYLTLWLPAWLDTCLDAGMWDLACELLAVAASLPDPADATGSAGHEEALSSARAAGREDAWAALAAGHGDAWAALAAGHENTWAARPPGHENTWAARPPGHENTWAARPPGHENTWAARPPGHENTWAARAPGHGDPWAALAACQDEAWAALAAARHPSGAIPEEAEGAADADGAPDFLGHYHSTLMAVFAGVLALDRLGDARVPPGRQGAHA